MSLDGTVTVSLPNPVKIQVKHRDIMQFAKKTCPHCYGKGEVTFVRGPKSARVRKGKLCNCALRRFLKVQPVDIDRATGAMYFEQSPDCDWSGMTQETWSEATAGGAGEVQGGGAEDHVTKTAD